MYEPTREEWKTITVALGEPIPADEIELKWADFKTKAGQEGEVLAYVTARGIRRRLDAVVPGGWAFHWEPVSLDAKGQVAVAKGGLTIFGVTREDVCEASTYSPSKGAVSGLEKRAGQQWGIGKDLYDLPDCYARADSRGKIPADYIDRWRAAYARRLGVAVETVATPRIAEDAPDTEAAPVAQAAASAAEVASTADAAKQEAEILTLPVFLNMIKVEGYTPKSALDALGVKSFAGVGLVAALDTLRTLASEKSAAARREASARQAVARIAHEDAGTPEEPADVAAGYEDAKPVAKKPTADERRAQHAAAIAQAGLKGRFLDACSKDFGLSAKDVEAKLPDVKTLDGLTREEYGAIYAQLKALQPVKVEADVNSLRVPNGGLDALRAYAIDTRRMPESEWLALYEKCKREPDVIRARFNYLVSHEGAPAAKAS